MVAGGDGSSRMIDSDVTVLPDPLSPTSPSVSPALTENETPSTTRTLRVRVANSSVNPSTTSRSAELGIGGAGGAEPLTVVRPRRP